MLRLKASTSCVFNYFFLNILAPIMPALLSVKVPCGECKKLFNNNWFLHLHVLRSHSGEKRLFLCPREGCDKKFTGRFKLESHVLGDHEGQKPFSCTSAGCGKSFAMKVSECSALLMPYQVFVFSHTIQTFKYLDIHTTELHLHVQSAEVTNYMLNCG